jgi:hypothetical protein
MRAFLKNGFLMGAAAAAIFAPRITLAQNMTEIPPNLTEATGPVKTEAQMAGENRAARAKALQVGNATTAGDFAAERSTLVSLGFHWNIEGDANRNASVAVTYRKAGEKAWRKALPLMRLQHEIVGNGAGARAADYGNPQPQSPFNYIAPNMFAGSILNLEPDTEYEAHFLLSDPDGVSGPKEKTVTVRTRKEPEPAAGGRVFHVYPIGYKGPRQEPSFTGLFAAYYLSCHTSDFENAFPARVQPGDTILVHAGTYLGDRVPYTSSAVPPGPNNRALCTLFDGTYFLTASGTPEKPIVIKGAGDGEVVFDGDGAQNLFNLMAANYNYFEGITVKNTNVAFLLGIKNIAGASGFTLKHSKVENVGRVVQDDWSGSKDFYITDNIFLGRHTPYKALGWNGVWSNYPDYPEVLGGQRGSEYAIKVYGQGHVVAYNYIKDWHDGIDVATYGDIDGTPQPLEDRTPADIDFYNNDFDNMGDNCIEGDGGARNIRIFRNRCFNSVGGALSAQPIQGGPAYYFQNIVYNTTTAGVLKYVNTSAGLLTYQNTFVGTTTTAPTSNDHFRNNLILGDGGTAPTFGVSTFTSYSTSDFNGFRINPGAKTAFLWAAPSGVSADYEHNPTPRRFASLADYQQATGQDRHSVALDYDVFRNVPIRDREDIQRLYAAGDFDFRLKPGSAAIGRGMELPTITDGHHGSTPDLGALQSGMPVWHWGPRPAPGWMIAGKIDSKMPPVWGWFYPDWSAGFMAARAANETPSGNIFSGGGGAPRRE